MSMAELILDMDLEMDTSARRMARIEREFTACAETNGGFQKYEARGFLARHAIYDEYDDKTHQNIVYVLAEEKIVGLTFSSTTAG